MRVKTAAAPRSLTILMCKGLWLKVWRCGRSTLARARQLSQFAPQLAHLVDAAWAHRQMQRLAIHNSTEVPARANHPAASVKTSMIEARLEAIWSKLSDIKKKDASKHAACASRDNQRTSRLRINDYCQHMGNFSRRAPASYPCDRLIPHPEDSLYRGVTIDASPKPFSLVLSDARGALQLRLIDNGGRQSPLNLLLTRRSCSGPDVMEIFQLADFARDQHLTFRIKANSGAQRLFGDIAGSYFVVAKGEGGCRLLVKLVVQHPPGVWGKMMRSFLPWGDLIMMRRQLLNFKHLAERDQLERQGN